MCSHLPIPESFDLVATLHDWQDFAGAIIGALMGVVGALIVASRGTQRERRIAASTVLPEVMGLRACNERINEVVKASYQTKGGRKRLVCNMLLKARPTISTLHSPVITQLYDIDARVYSHIFQTHWLHEQFEPALERYRQEVNNTRAPHSSIYDAASSELALDVRAVEATHPWDLCVEHATLANYYLDRFVFRRWPNWIFRLRMRYFPNDLDQRSEYLLATGMPLQEAEATAEPPLDPDTPI